MNMLYEVMGDAPQQDPLPSELQALVNRGVVTEEKAREQWAKTKAALLNGVSDTQNLYG